MSQDREAMQQALEALELMHNPDPVQVGKAIDALRARLAQADTPVAWVDAQGVLDRVSEWGRNMAVLCHHPRSKIAVPLYASPQTRPSEIDALLAKVPLPPNAITYEKGWELLDELQRIAVKERA